MVDQHTLMDKNGHCRRDRLCLSGTTTKDAVTSFSPRAQAAVPLSAVFRFGVPLFSHCPLLYTEDERKKWEKTNAGRACVDQYLACKTAQTKTGDKTTSSPDYIFFMFLLELPPS